VILQQAQNAANGTDEPVVPMNQDINTV